MLYVMCLKGLFHRRLFRVFVNFLSKRHSRCYSIHLPDLMSMGLAFPIRKWLVGIMDMPRFDGLL